MRKGGPQSAQRLVVATVGLAAAAALVADLTGPLWAPLLSLGYSGVLRLAVWAAAAAAVVLACQALLRAEDRPWSFLSVAVVASVGGQGVGLVLLAVGHATPSAYMAGLAIGTAAGAFLGLVLSGSIVSGIPNRVELRRALSLGLPLIPHSLAVFLLVSADRVAISHILGLGDVGRYQVAYAIGGLGVSLITALNQAWIPLLLGTSEEQRWDVLAATSRAVHHFAAIVASGLAIVAPLAMLVAAPASYGRGELASVSAVVAFSILPYATGATFLHGVFLEGRTKMMAVAAPLAVVVNVAVNLALLPSTGLMGAAVATVLAYAFLAAFVAWASRRIVHLPGVLADSLYAWALAAPFVTAGALLPSSLAGVAIRVVLGAVLIAAGAGLAVRISRPRLTQTPAVVRS
jgi:O-antigen/teichoic acid export membrane protein